MKKSISFGALIVGLALITACIPANPTPTPISPESIYTAAAQTVEARYTLAAGESAVAELTRMAAPATATLTPPPTTPPIPRPNPTEAVQGPVSTVVPLSTFTATLPPTATPAICDWVLFVGDISVVDNTSIAPGAAFTKTWRFKNIGSCTWTPAYMLVFVGGTAMSGSLAQSLPAVALPGDIIDLSVNLVAPTVPGIYRGEWMLRSPDGRLFGVGQGADVAFGVQIQVSAPPQTGEFTYDFAANYCSAVWRSGSGSLGCPGSSADLNGAAILLDQPDLETTTEDEPALWTRPDSLGGGWISGQFPLFRVRNGDRFVAEIGCLSSSRGCDVTFALDALLTDGRIRSLGEWDEVYDGLTTRINLDLSSLAGSWVQFMLSVYNNGSPQAANAFWLVPHIQGVFTSSELVLTWHQEGGPQDDCKEVRVFLTGRRSGEARGTTCKGAIRDLGTIQLDDSQANQLTELFNRLKTFESEVYSPSSGEPFNTWMSFTGGGSADASNADILTLQNLGSQLFAEIED